MKKTLIFLIRAYQKVISPDTGILLSWRTGRTCRFYPSCSEYAIQAINKYGVVRGSSMAVRRISRCTPHGGAEIDEP